MKKNRLLFYLSLIVTLITSSQITTAQDIDFDQSRAEWITYPDFEHSSNQWFKLRRSFTLEKTSKVAIAKISADSKYWLWINGELVLFEGQLKRGPNPNDTYYDEIDIAPWLKRGENIVAIQLWYYGKDGFSHRDSRVAGLYFDCNIGDYSLVTDNQWKISIDKAYQNTGEPQANYRLSESNVKYVAKNRISGWQDISFDDSKWRSAQPRGEAGVAPWNNLVLRPIPQWKDYGLKLLPFTKEGNRVTAELPYNMQFHVYFKVKAKGGETISCTLDNFYHTNGVHLRMEYVADSGVQEYEHKPWLNGHKIYLDIEDGVEILEVGYRETGFATEFTGDFNCSDPFLNTLHQKSLRTLYVTMRDNYMDCPDRERAQWWGDLVLEMEETFYVMDTTANSLTRKAIRELVDWQRADSVIYSPTPEGNWKKELPQQMLASIGWYGFRNYVLYTGEVSIYDEVFESVEKYLSLWSVEESGHVPFKGGGWNWSDWGGNIDVMLLEHAWYSLALESYAEMAMYKGYPDRAEEARAKIAKIKEFVNNNYWTPEGYRSTRYKRETDDRGNAMMVLANIADRDKYSTIVSVLDTVYHASPYMEKYVEESLFLMGRGDIAVRRMKERYKPMVDSWITTLWEVFHTPNQSYNHAWSGGPLTHMYKYMAGIRPTKMGFEEFEVFPDPIDLKSMTAVIPSVKGEIKFDYKDEDSDIVISLVTPNDCTPTVRVPKKASLFSIKGGKYEELKLREDSDFRYYRLDVESKRSSKSKWRVRYSL